MTIHTTRKGNKHGDEITRATYRSEKAAAKKVEKPVQVKQAEKVKKVITKKYGI